MFFFVFCSCFLLLCFCFCVFFVVALVFVIFCCLVFFCVFVIFEFFCFVFFFCFSFKAEHKKTQQNTKTAQHNTGTWSVLSSCPGGPSLFPPATQAVSDFEKMQFELSKISWPFLWLFFYLCFCVFFVFCLLCFFVGSY